MGWNRPRGQSCRHHLSPSVLPNHEVGKTACAEEPLPLDHPLRQLPNTVITPHLGYVTVEGYKVFYSHVVEDVQAFLPGKPARVINSTRG
jgi:lactate dehydrogenase-like 2-hydroxyacid dehydrogenase